MMVFEAVLGLAALLGATAGIWRYLRIGAFKQRISNFLDDWNGEPARPADGYEGRPSFPRRMADVEVRTRQLNHDFRDDIGGRLALVEELLTTLDERTKQLQRNGGSSVADVVHKVAADLERLQETASANGQSIVDLTQRMTEVDKKVVTANERITDHRRRQVETIEELRRYLEQERIELLTAKQGLEASVSELLMVDGHEERDTPRDEDQR